MTIPVVFTNPVAGQVLANDIAQTITWTQGGQGGALPQSRLRYRPVGAATWTVDNAVRATSVVLSAGTFTAGTWELQRTIVGETSGDTGSATVVFTAAPSSVTPTVSAPTSPVTAPTATVTWVTSPTTQYAYQVQVMNGLTVVWDSGMQVSSAQTLAGVPFPDSGQTRTVRVRVLRAQTGYAFSQWGTTGTLTVTHTPPATPTITALTPLDFGSIGVTHQLSATITQPTPSGGQPVVTSTEVSIRVQGDTGPGWLVFTSPTALTSYRYATPSAGKVYEMRLRVVSADGRYAISPWVAASGPVAIVGVVLSSVTSLDVARLFRLNEDGASEVYEPVSSLMQYDGREFPTVEYGTASERSIEVASLRVKTAAEVAQLRALLLARQPVLYRDKRGRKLYGRMSIGAVEDTFYGYDLQLKIDAIDYTSDLVP